MLDRKTNDKIRKSTSISYICINGNNVKWISCMRRKCDICYMYVACLFCKNNNAIGISSNQKSLSSVGIHSLTCNINSLTGVNGLFM